MKRRTRGFAGALCLVVLAAAGPAQADWTTYHADPALTGVDTTSGTALPFATAWTAANLVGDIYAEPLVYNGIVIVATEESLAAVPNSMREGSYACGGSKWQTIRHIVLPRAMAWAMLKVLPEPVTPMRTWNFFPASTPAASLSMAAG